MMSPIAKNGSGRTDWKFYWNLLLPLLVTLAIAGVPVLVGIGVMQSRLETPETKRVRISQMLQPVKDRVTKMEAQIAAFYKRMDDHHLTPAHGVMLERSNR